jgi:L-seryl-tRNA(Ser) seleniumtransferase
MNDLRSLPSVDLLLQSQSGLAWQEAYGRPLTLQAVRDVLESVRTNYRSGSSIPDRASIEKDIQLQLDKWTAPSLIPVINASGVVLHTNLGRAPLSRSAVQAILSVSSGYSNLEFDLASGRRGSRLVHAEALLQRLTGAEAALVVNNNAAAVLLVLSTLARRRGVIISRTQLVEIGGGFRVPDVMKQSGARLIEVGTTNRVHLSDYSQAIAEENPALIMHAHRSNFRIVGFTTEPDLAEVVQTAHQAGIPVVDDLGSGAMLDTAEFGLAHEPTVNESLDSGADLTCFSGDKLLGGPQSGIIIGRAALVNKLKKHPLARAIRADKTCLAALSATLEHYLRDEACREIPVWQMISTSPENIRQRAQAWSEALGVGSICQTRSTIGGGSLPEETLPSFALCLSVANPNHLMEMLRKQPVPIIARLEENRIWLDPRTVLIDQEYTLLEELRCCLQLSQPLTPTQEVL